MPQEPAYYFDATTQREVLLEPAAARKWITHLEGQGLIGDPMRVVWLRILGDLDDAEALGWHVLNRSGGPTRRKLPDFERLPLSAVTAAIRLAHVLQWRGQFETAHRLYDLALDAVESVEVMSEDSAYADYLHPFAYQHLARFHFDQSDYQRAIEVSQKALTLRDEAGIPPDQILGSEEFIAAATSLMGEGSVL